MSLSPLIKYIYSSGSDEVIKRGKRIFLTGGVQMMKRDEFSGQLTFKVRNDIYYNQYNVTISKYHDPSALVTRCNCPYNMGEICRHEAAALFHLNDLILHQRLDASEAVFDQKHTMIRMKVIELKTLRLFTSTRIFGEAEQWLQQNKVQINQAANEVVQATLTEDGNSYQLILKRNDDRSFDTSCTCHETRYALCKHKVALFLQLLNHFGATYFDSIRNWDTQKNKLLALYGYSLQDDLKGKFEFTEVEGKPILKVLDSSIKKIGQATPEWKAPLHQEPVTTFRGKKLGIVINLKETEFPYFSIELIQGEASEDDPVINGTIEVLDLNKIPGNEDFTPVERELLSLVRKMQKSEIARFIARNSPFGDLWENIHDHHTEWNTENAGLLFEYLHPKLLRLFALQRNQHPVYLLPAGKAFKSGSLIKTAYADHSLQPYIEVKKLKSKGFAKVHLFTERHGTRWTLRSNRLKNPLLFLFDQELVLIHKPADALRLFEWGDDRIIKASEWEDVLNQKLLPLCRFYDIQFDQELVENRYEADPLLKIYLSEQGSYFILKPVFVYGSTEASWNEEASVSSLEDGKLVIIHRNKTKEETYIQELQQLHPHLRVHETGHQLMLHSKYALQKNWFFLFFEKMKERNIELLGHSDLRQFRIHPSKPSTQLHISSNLDWFDTAIEVDFDGQKARLQDIQKALATKQNYVPLSDGTLGLLPEEWLQKFSLLFKMGEYHQNQIRVNKFNFSIIDSLYDMIDDEALKLELKEKSDILLNANPGRFEEIPVPTEVKAVLRPYQEAGFRWLCFLDSVKWGGLLADDMGLGKTIQTLCFLQYFKNSHHRLKALVICPTTLLYNWENEIKKFTPSLTYIKHHGNLRSTSPELLLEYDILISTYGTLRSDVQLFSRIPIDYMILDESQTIKNPGSKVAKAAQLIPCRNRIALSGTPMQNNTFDIYSQMNFLNPGMLGTKEFFREQFAKPVDKFQDEESKTHLRKLIYPFLLRRTKEQVAQDLPEKTEVTLFCEMGREQRAIYDTYRELYRSRILGSIEEIGMERSQFAILQGLMKLRQICDSPAILNETEPYENHSAKLDELVRELEENTGKHKVLIFSQFLGMLSLIREKLQEQGIVFQYFDGSYTSAQREKAIQEFQTNDDCAVFLISLKAGGMGLNLTAADYVYLMDPWWNPAVEQQAIDRTHRIGQTKNIFAYRFICKDSVEEKIMLLKEKKNMLVKDIISDDGQMMKQLSKEDIAYLFS